MVSRWFLLIFILVLKGTAYCQKCNPKPGNKITAEQKNINKAEVTKILDSRGEIWIDWKKLVEPSGCYIHFDEITMFYGRKKVYEKLPCCEGFKNVTVNPKQSSKPWLIKDLCREGPPPQGGSQIYLRFRLGKIQQQRKWTLKSIPPCTVSQRVTKSIDQYWPVFVVGGIFLIFVVVCLIAICCHYRKSKKPSTYHHHQQPRYQHHVTKSSTHSHGKYEGEHDSNPYYFDDHEMESMDDWYSESPRHHEERSQSGSQEFPEEESHSSGSHYRSRRHHPHSHPERIYPDSERSNYYFDEDSNY